jgi:hypothetical protein
MRPVQLPEVCGLTIVHHLDTNDLSKWATSCHSTKKYATAAIQARRTMLPSLMILYVSAYLQPQAIARLTSAGIPWAYLLQALFIPAGKESSHVERHTGVVFTIRRPPMLLRPLRLGAHSPPYPQGVNPKWRSELRVHVAGYRGGLDGAMSQWHRMTPLLDMAHKTRETHNLLSAMVGLPGGHLSKLNWETELLRRLKDHRKFLSSLSPPRRRLASSDSDESGE